VSAYRRWRDRFAAAMEGSGFFGISYLDHLVEGSKKAIVWPGEQAAIVTEFRHFPGPDGRGVKVLHGLVAAGDLEEIVDRLIPAAEAWGRRQGCAFALIESRQGWERALRPSGYRIHQVSIVKEL
jgi:hypothetical protein